MFYLAFGVAVCVCLIVSLWLCISDYIHIRTNEDEGPIASIVTTLIRIAIAVLVIGASMTLLFNSNNWTAYECGVCGAHVNEVWYIASDDSTSIEVCQYCYLDEREAL